MHPNNTGKIIFYFSKVNQIITGIHISCLFHFYSPFLLPIIVLLLFAICCCLLFLLLLIPVFFVVIIAFFFLFFVFAFNLTLPCCYCESSSSILFVSIIQCCFYCLVFELYWHVSSQSNETPAQRPQLRIVTPHGLQDNDEVSADALSIRGFEHFRCDDYHLGEHTVI